MPVLRAADREEVGGGLEHLAARQGDDPSHSGRAVAHEGVAQPHEEGRDAAVVTGARGAQQRVDVGVQEELDDGEPVRGSAIGAGRHRQVDEGEARDVAEEIVADRRSLEQFDDPLIRRTLAERRHRGDPDDVGVGGVRREPKERRGGDGVPHEAQGLDEPRPGFGCGDPEECPLHADDQLLGRRCRPALQRALRQHAGESAIDHHAEERTHRVRTREDGTEGPGRVLTEERPLVRQQRDQHAPRLAVEHLGNGVGRRDRGQLVVAPQRLGEHPDGADAGIAPGLEGQVVGETHGVDDRRRSQDGVERGLDSHGAPPQGWHERAAGAVQCCG